jgi:hypothetical protein
MLRPVGFKPALVYFFLLALTTRTIARNWNDQARVATVDSLVERHTFAIDGSIFRGTGDKILIDGRFYSNKPPVMDLAGAAVFLPIYEAFGVSLSTPRSAEYYLLTLLLIGVPSAFGVALLDRSFHRRGFARKDRLLAVTGFGCATLVWPYSTVINNHTLGGVLLLLGVLLLAPGARSTNARVLLGALALGFSATIDLPPAAIFAVVFLAYVPLGSGVRRGAWFLAGLAPPLLLQVALQLVISGDVLPVNLHREYWDFPGSPWIGTPISGEFHFASVGQAAGDVFHSLLGSRGFFSYSPFLLVGAAGLVAAAWSSPGEERGHARATLLAVAPAQRATADAPLCRSLVRAGAVRGAEPRPRAPRLGRRRAGHQAPLRRTRPLAPAAPHVGVPDQDDGVRRACRRPAHPGTGGANGVPADGRRGHVAGIRGRGAAGPSDRRVPAETDTDREPSCACVGERIGGPVEAVRPVRHRQPAGRKCRPRLPDAAPGADGRRLHFACAGGGGPTGSRAQ